MVKPSCVLDTNIIISGILFGGNSREIIRLGMQKKINIYLSAQILLETSRVFYEKFKLTNEEIELILKGLARISTLVEPQIKLDIVKKDSSDNMVIECAYCVKADFVISGDKHLLELKKYKNINLITPSQFLDLISSKLIT
ncbi:putative toxin-antitoxin system toxin component, PIN family [Patescibacteria group bacterium]|nr:putative toxin-antitoxin system toxin component, PIN family [Patescibacteria group bacterium]